MIPWKIIFSQQNSLSTRPFHKEKQQRTYLRNKTFYFDSLYKRHAFVFISYVIDILYRYYDKHMQALNKKLFCMILNREVDAKV